MKSQTLDDKHRHNYTKVILVRINKVHNNYSGTVGDRAYLARECDCEVHVAFEYGTFTDMKELYKQITGVTYGNRKSKATK